MKADENRKRFLGLFRKTTLRIKDETGPIYLIRYSLLTLPWFSVKLHKIMMSDDDCPHDHPWSFISIILWGGYIEHVPIMTIDSKQVVYYRSKRYGRGSILWRPNPWPHKLEIHKPATTLVITFKRVRSWGFITPSGWREWYTYIRSGRKCE